MDSVLQDMATAPRNTKTLEDYIKYGGAPRLTGKYNYATPHKINPATMQATSGFNKAFMEQRWYQDKFLLRKRNAMRCDQHLYDFNGTRVPYERGSRFKDIGAGTVGNTHTGLHQANGSLLHHNYDKIHTHPHTRKNISGIPIYNPRSYRGISQI